MNKKTPIVIVSPRQHHGGPVVLHLLCKLLIEKGYNAKIFIIEGGFPHQNESLIRFWIRWSKNSLKDTAKLFISKIFKDFKFVNKPAFNGYSYMPVKKYRRKYTPFVSRKTIVLYPEICYGNPLRAKKVIRWLLFHNRFPDDVNAYGKDDLFFCFREFFNDFNLNPECRVLKLNNFDYELYRQTNFNERSGKCYMIRKGKDRTDLPQKFDGPVLDNLPEWKIVECFNKYKYCYFYDTQSFYSSIASICGCIPIIVLEKGKSKKDYLKNGDHSYGRAYGDSSEEISYAKETRENLIKTIDDFKIKNNINLENFIKECEKYF